MTELTDERLAELRTIAEAATPGPWEWDGLGDFYDKPRMHGWLTVPPCVPGGEAVLRSVALHADCDIEASDGDAAHIAAFDPPTVLALLDEDDRLRKFAQRTQERDWARLNDALQHAANGAWSMECDYVVGEIVDSYAVIGAWTPDTAIPYGPLLLDGIYEAITGIPVSEETLAGCRAYFASFPDRHIFADSAPVARKSAEEARGGR